MKWIIFSLNFLSVIPNLWAMSNGAPTAACSDLMPLHDGAQSTLNNNIFFLMSDVIGTGLYTPGETYTGKTSRMN